MKIHSILLGLLAVVAVEAQSTTILIPAGSTWRYQDNGQPCVDNWPRTNFNDAAWAVGAGRLGFGGDGEQTVLHVGYITYYFRGTFTATNVSATSNLQMRLQRDDGAIVYLNGTEVFRSNMHTGVVDYLTLASSSVKGTDETNVFLSPLITGSLLVTGINVVAAEVHQAVTNDSDLGFDLELVGNVSVPASLTVQIPAGYSTIANNFNLGGDTLDEVIPVAADGTEIYRWNFATQSYSNSVYDANIAGWSPNLSLASGEGAWIHSFIPQGITFLTPQPEPPGLVARPPTPGLRFVGCRWPVSSTFEEMMGFAPIEGDRILFYEGSFAAIPAQPTEVFTFSNGAWPFPQRLVEPGKAVFVDLAAVVPPFFVQQPQSRTATEGDLVLFSASASGTPPLQYQWRKDGVPLPGAVFSFFGITNAALRDAGAYSVVVSNPGGSVTSSNAILTVNPCPFVACPSDIVAECQSMAGAVVSFSAFATNWCNSADLLLGFSPPSGTLFPPGTNKVIAWAIGSGMSNVCSFNVIVQGDCSPGSRTNLLGNGSFELPGNSNGYIRLGPNGPISIPGWLISGSGVEYFGATSALFPTHDLGTASDGGFAVGLGVPGGAVGGGLEQTFVTIPGFVYSVDFDATTLKRGDGDGTATIIVTVGGSNRVFNLSNDQAYSVWQPKGFAFTADASFATLSFSILTDAALHFAAIDHARVYAHPLSGPGLLGPRFGVRIGDHVFSRTTTCNWSVREVPIQYPAYRMNSGRINAIAVNPVNDREMFVASESGGVFKSTSAGSSWTHVDSLPVHDTLDITYLPGHRTVLYASAGDDFRHPSGAGLWRSADGGETWSQPAGTAIYDGGPGSVGPHTRCGGKPAAFGIAVEPGSGKIFVATTCGILIGTDAGDWRLQDSPGFGREDEWRPAEFRGIAVLGGGRVIASGATGFWWSGDSGENWERASGIPPLNQERSQHSVCASPLGATQAFAVSGAPGNYHLYFTSDSGRTWSIIPDTDPGGAASGGNPFIRALAGTSVDGSIDLFFGNTYSMSHRLVRPAGASLVYLTSWEGFVSDHPDVRDVAFSGGVARFLADDGGLEIWNPAVSAFQFVGGGNGGLSAWQFMWVAGQRVGSQEYLYVASQDNGIRASDDNGLTWPPSYWGGVEGWGGFQMERTVGSEPESFIFWNDGFDHIGGPLFRRATTWVSPPHGAGGPVLVARGTWIQVAYNEGAPDSKPWELWLRTGGSDGPWRKVTSLYQPVEFPVVAGGPSDPTIWIPMFKDSRITLVRISNIMNPDSPAMIHEPAMTNCSAEGVAFGSLGINPTMWAIYKPFAADPGNPEHLIAPDALNGGIKESWNGGECWQDMTELNNLVSRSGTLRMTRLFTRDWSPQLLVPLVSAVSFCPENPNYVVVGTHEGGLFYSTDRGVSWIEIPGSAGVKPVTKFYWQSPESIYIATYGRGLWNARIACRSEVSPGDLGSFEFCPAGCFVFPGIAGLPPDPRPRDFDRAFYAYDGMINDAEVKNGMLFSLSLSPGALAFDFESDAVLGPSVALSYSQQTGQFSGLPGVKALVDSGKIIRGITFDHGLVQDVIYGSSMATLDMPAPQTPASNPGGGENFAPGPRINLATTNILMGFPIVVGGDPITFSGDGFLGDIPIQIDIDGQRLGQSVLPDSNGIFSTTLSASLSQDLHLVRAIQTPNNGPDVTGHRFFVARHEDEEADQDAIEIKNPRLIAGNIVLQFATKPSQTYQIEAADELRHGQTQWHSVATLIGDGTTYSSPLPVAPNAQRFFRVRSP